MNKKIKKKVEHLMRFIGHLDQCTKESFDKLCEEKEIKNV